MTTPIDTLIIGGGIAGLWTHAHLRALGYSSLLIETAGLGAGQTLASQGIIHGGTKYALHGQLTGAAQAIAAMPAAWREALAGTGTVNLVAARVLSPHQYLWTASAIGSKLTAFFAGKVMQNRMARLPAGALPDFLPKDYKGHCYALEEPVLDIPAVLAAIANAHADSIITGADWQEDNGVFTVGELRLQPAVQIYTAGENNQPLTGSPQQLRPLFMTALRVPAQAPDIYGHCLGMSDKPKITITTHPENRARPDGEKVYWIGGQPAEEGVGRSTIEQTHAVQALLRETLPWLPADWTADESNYRHIAINRAEGSQGGKRPDLPVIAQRENRLTLWPTKLAFAPLAAEHIAAKLPAPAYPQPENVNKTKPAIAPYPWTV